MESTRRPSLVASALAALALTGCPGDDVAPDAGDNPTTGGFYGTGSTTDLDPTLDVPTPGNDVPNDPTDDPTADPTDDPTGDPGAVTPGLIDLTITTPEQVLQAPAAFAEMLGFGATVIIAGESSSSIVDLSNPGGEHLLLGPGLGTVLAPRPGEDDIWDAIVYGGEGGVFAYGVDAEGVLDFGYAPFGPTSKRFVTDMRLVDDGPDPVIAFAAGTESGLLRPDSGLWSYDFAFASAIEASLGVAIPSGDVSEPWFVVSDGFPGSLFSFDDPFEPVATLGNSPRLPACTQMGTSDHARCGVPNFGDGTVQMFDIAADGAVTPGPTLMPGGNTVRVFVDETASTPVWHFPLFDENAVGLCTADCDDIVVVDLPCNGPGHTTVIDGSWIGVTCSQSDQLFTEDVDVFYASLFE